MNTNKYAKTIGYLKTIKLYKITNEKEEHNGFQYQEGLNVLIEEFKDEGTCVAGGFYFTNKKNIYKYIDYGVNVREVTLPFDDPELKVVMDPEGDKWRSNKIIFTADKKYSMLDPLTYDILGLDVKEFGLCNLAAEEGNLEVLKWARENGCDWDRDTCACAAKGGHLEVLKWARENGCDWNSWTCNKAAEKGHLDVLKWARENGCDWNSMTCANAAGGGHLNVLKWARENGCDWNSYICAYAASEGHLDVLKWARENGCEWDSDTCACAARGGHLEILKWARENGCDWSSLTCAYAAEGGHLEVLKWVRENGL